MVTIMDVAREAGVGIGTVSRVINGSPLVSPATRQRVIAAIGRLGYQPSPIARAFGGRRTDKLEVLVASVAEGFALELLRGIQDALVDTDYTLLVRTIDDAAERDRVFADCCQRGRTEGAILVWMPPTQALVERTAADTFPIVALNAWHPRIASVVVDHADSAHRAVTYCAGLGHQRIALVDSRADPFEPSSDGICHAGYVRGLDQAQLELAAQYELIAEAGARGGAEAAAALLSLSRPPTAVITATVGQALGVIDAARIAGLRVPQDLSVVGYNDSRLATEFGVTTMHVPLRELGGSAVELLLMLLAEPDLPPQVRRHSAELMVRRTCAPPREATASA